MPEVIELDVLGAAMARTVKAAVGPLLARLAAQDEQIKLLSGQVKELERKHAGDDALVSRIVDLEARAPVPGPKGDPGEKGESGRDAEVVDLVALAKSAATYIPTPKDGTDGRDGKDADNDLMLQELTKAVAAIPVPKDGRDGKDLSVEDVTPFLSELVAKAVDALPKPHDGKDGIDGKDGQSVQLADVEAFMVSAIEKAVSAIPRAKDGVGMLGALIDRDGQLVVTLSDGTTKELGVVVGRDVDMNEVARLITEKVAGIPVKEGAPGKDGRDGTLEEASVEQVDERTVEFRRKDGSVLGVVKLYHPIYRGVYVAGKAYERGDSVTFGGNQWIAHEATTTKPAEGKAWQLAVRAGRDGREGKSGPEGKQGPQGPGGVPGRDYR